MNYPRLIENLIEQLSKLPGVGRRSAERMVFWLLNHSTEEAQTLSESIVRLKEGLRFCRRCYNLSETDICPICADTRRDQQMICVVENPKDLLAIERSGVYKGCYHVLLGAIAPSEGKGPEQLTIEPLLTRIKSEGIREVLLATDPDNEGEMTALYLIKQLKSFPVKVTRIGLGLPMGSAIEYADMSTLGMSLNSRREVSSGIESALPS